MTTLVSIVIVNYNRERYLAAAIESVLKQTYSNFELLIWDDGSTDRSTAIAQHYAQQDPRIRVVTARHQGVTQAAHNAIAQTQGTYLGCVDSDDILAPTALAKTVAILERDAAIGLVYTDYVEMDEASKITGYGRRCQIPYSQERLLVDFMTFHFRLMRRPLAGNSKRSTYERSGGIDPTFSGAAYDYDLCLKLSEVTQVHHLNQPLYFYRRHAQSVSNTQAIEQIVWSQRAIERALQRRGLGDRTIEVQWPRGEFHLRRADAAKRSKQTRQSAIVCSLLATLPVMVAETPLLAQVAPAIDGTGTIVTPNANQIDITGGTRSGANLFHSFSQFGVRPEQIINFESSPALQNILGRVSGGNASVIEGLVRVSGSNANLFLMNPAGMIFGTNARLDVSGSFTATTATGIGFNNQWFNATGANNYATLMGSPNAFAFTTQPGVIVNAGNLSVNGNLMLLGGTVVNTGQLSAPNGQITVTSVPGQQVIRLSQVGSLLSLEVMPDRDSSNWTLPIATLPQLLTGGNLSSATGITINPNGTIQLVGSTTPLPTPPGTTLISGQVTAPKINLFGNQVGLIRANLNASTPNQGGTIRIGGDYQGKGTVPNAAQTFVSSDSQIAANSLLDGDGGRVIIWSNDHTQFLGTIAAQGGKNSGNGGFVEVSGKNALTFKGQVDVSAPKGSLGNLLLDPTTLTIIDAPTGGTFDATAGNIPFGLPDNGANTVSWGAIGASGANVSLQATGNITINAIAGNTPGVTTPGLASLNAANFSLTSTNGSVIFANPNDTIQVRGGNITIAGNSLALGNLDTSFLGSSNSGIVTLTANGNITADDIITSGNGYSGGDINVTSNAGEINLRNLDSTNRNGFRLQNAGSIQIAALAGNVIINSINASTTKTNGSGEFTGTAGTINLTARNNITVNTDINASAIVTNVDGIAGAIAGNVTLTSTNPNPGNNIRFGSINTQAITDAADATTAGGNVSVSTNGRIQGTGTTTTGDTINTQRLVLGTETLPDTSLQGGNVAIRHDGGVNNDPFTIGNSALNGTAAPINIGGGTTISAGNFPVLANGGTAAGTPPGVTIISVNTPPTITTNPLLSTNALPNQALPFTFTANTGDTNLDNTTVIIDAIVAGTLRRGTTVLNVGDAIVVGETLNYTPPNNTVGLVNAFRVRASDRVSDSAPQAIALNIPTPTLTDCTLNCKDNPPGGNLPTPDQITPANRPLLNPNLTPEDRFTSSFADYLGIFSPERKTEDDGQSLAQKVEKATGVRPAFIYASFVPTDLGGTKAGTPRTIAAQDSDQLELLVVTAKGVPLRKRIPGATRAKVLRVADDFRNELINQRNLGTDTYLQLAQQLYGWLIAPIDADLQARNINNLVFLPDTGLRSTPIAALHDGQGYLVERYSVGLMPSLSLTNTVITDIKDSQLLAMGVSQSTQGQEPLPAVPVELSTLVAKIWRGQLVLDTQTTLQNLKTLRGQQRYGILHMATHASFNPGPVGDSYIQLWDDKLRLDQVRQLGLNDPQVEMMVLSACKTALGNEEAELGFAGLAVLSGVKTTVASLWAVNDAGTAALIIKFYENLKTAPTKSEALRRAQLAMIKGEVYLKDGQIQGLGAIGGVPLPAASVDTVDEPLSHPYYWSGFTMVGNPW
ncbi:CHAT domain-containing protein [Phormidesmis priestleyi]